MTRCNDRHRAANRNSGHKKRGLGKDQRQSLPASDASTCRLIPGDGTLTRRILKCCRDRGIHVREEGAFVRVGGGRWGFRRDAYIVPSDIYEQEVGRRTAEKELERRAKAEQEERERIAQRRQRIDELTAKFPKLAPEAIKLLADKGKPVYATAEVGYQFGRGTKSYWNQLGYRVKGQSFGFVVRGKRLYPVYAIYCLAEKRSQVTVEQLCQAWRQKYGSDEIVLAEAIRIANRLQKVKKRIDFYPLKDQWIRSNQHNLVEGRIARHEKQVCWSCDGSGIIEYGDDCWKCDGSGIYSSRILYEHIFEVCGRRYTFHSYTRPRQVSATPGADLAVYGRPFGPNELPLPPQAVVVTLVNLLLCQDKGTGV